MIEMKDIGLPKWSGIVVKGDTVSTTQAAEIILKTDSYMNYPYSNDKIFYEYFKELFNVPEEPKETKEILSYFEKYDNFLKDINYIKLEYLKNSRISSMYINGSRGWCDWDGSIQCNNYNIGKWPSCEEVYQEWEMIAHNFPFLSLKCQLFNGEYCEYPIKPVIEYVISNGKVEVKEPTIPMEINPNIDCEFLNKSNLKFEHFKEKVIEVYKEIPKFKN